MKALKNSEFSSQEALKANVPHLVDSVVTRVDEALDARVDAALKGVASVARGPVKKAARARWNGYRRQLVQIEEDVRSASLDDVPRGVKSAIGTFISLQTITIPIDYKPFVHKSITQQILPDDVVGLLTKARAHVDDLPRESSPASRAVYEQQLEKEKSVLDDIAQSIKEEMGKKAPRIDRILVETPLGKVDSLADVKVELSYRGAVRGLDARVDLANLAGSLAAIAGSFVKTLV